MSNHLGNVLSVISDKVIPHQNVTTVDYFLADIRQSSDYSPFGVTLQGRNFTASGGDGFRFGFQGQEMDDEVKGVKNSYTTEFRQYDPRIGRWLTIDPLFKNFPWQSPYVSYDNNPLVLTDKKGLSAENANGSEPSQHTIKKGETLYGIAKKSNGAFSVDDLMKWNSGIDPKRLQIGQVIFTSNPKTADFNNALQESILPFNPGEYKIRPDNLALASNFGFNYTVPNLYTEFEHGTGPEKSVLLGSHWATKQMKSQSIEINRLRKEVYKKFSGNLQSMQAYASKNNQAIYTRFAGYGGSFKPWNEGSNCMQFIGTFSADVFLSYDGKSLLFVVTDTKSKESLFYRMSDNTDRKKGEQTRYGTTYQKYIWREPFNPNLKF